MNSTFEASNATYRNFVADAAMLDPNFLAELPQNCQSLGLRGCFEQNGQFGSSTLSSATPTASSHSASTQDASTTIASTAIPTSSGEPTGGSGGLSTGAKAGIGAGVGAIALIAVLSGMLFVLKRVKRNRAAVNPAVPSAEAQQTSYGDIDPQHKVEPQTYAHIETNSPVLATSSPAEQASNVEQIHEIDGRARHEK